MAKDNQTAAADTATEIIKTKGRGKAGGSEASISMDLSSPDSSRETFAEAITLYTTGKISENQARTIAYLMQHYLSYWRFIKDLDIEQRLEAIEESLRGRADD